MPKAQELISSAFASKLTELEIFQLLCCLLTPLLISKILQLMSLLFISNASAAVILRLSGLIKVGFLRMD